MAEEKQFQASDKKLRKAREEGDLPKSSVLTQFLVILGGCSTVGYLLQGIWERIPFLVQYCLIEGFKEPLRATWLLGIEGLKIVGTVFLGIFVSALIAEVSQVGFMWRPQLGLPKLERLNPVSGFGKLFGGFKNLLTLVLKAGIIISLAAWTLSETFGLGGAVLNNIDGAIDQSSRVLSSLLKNALVVFGLFAAFDFIQTRRKYRIKHSMSVDELRREHKEEDGNPELKGQRKHLHRAMIMQDLVTRVKKSKMIVVSKRESA